MAPMYPFLRIFALGIVTMVFIMVLGLQAGPVTANGDSIPVFSGTSGSYSVTIGVLPRDLRVGTVHITVTPLDSATSEPITDARVSILAIDPEGEPAYHAVAVNTPNDPEYYDANFLIERTGMWSIEVGISSEGRGEAEFVVDLEVSSEQPNSGRLGTGIWAGAVAIMVGGGAYLTYSIRRSQQSRQ